MKYSGDNALHVGDFFESLVQLRKRYDKSELPTRDLVTRTMEHFVSVARANKIDSVFLAKEAYKRRADTGICTYCGKNQAVPGRRKCVVCAELTAVAQRRRRARLDLQRESRAVPGD